MSCKNMNKLLLNTFILLICGFLLSGEGKSWDSIDEYPHYQMCITPEYHAKYISFKASYDYLTDHLRLHRNCTHIYGTLMIADLKQVNGKDPDLSFLEHIQEISGQLKIEDNRLKRIPLKNLRVIRGNLLQPVEYALEIKRNLGPDGNSSIDIDLSNLKLIQNGGVYIRSNPHMTYLPYKVNWKDIVVNSNRQKIEISESPENVSYPCHPDCSNNNKLNFSIEETHCFGPHKNQCQEITKCQGNKNQGWCRMVKNYQGIYEESACNNECEGGCKGPTASDCHACRYYHKNGKCTSTCDSTSMHIFGHMTPTQHYYTIGGLCTKRCPESLLYQDKSCVYTCDFDNYYKYKRECIRCPHNKCYEQFRDTLVCNLEKLSEAKDSGRLSFIDLALLKKLTHCTLLVGQLSIEDYSFTKGQVTIPLLYKHLSNVKEIIGELYITNFHYKDLKNLTFLQNVQEIRRYTIGKTFQHGLKVFSNFIEFLGLKSLEKVYGDINIQLYTKSKCYSNAIPYKQLAYGRYPSKFNCNSTCDPLCTNGCWGPTNQLCFRCEYLKAGDYCVKNCSDAPGYFTSHNKTLVSDGQKSIYKPVCFKCHKLCRDYCTGPLPSQCGGKCKYAVQNGTCVKKCSINYHATRLNGLNIDICKPCHSSCYNEEGLLANNFKSACTGSSNRLGKGGCNMCEKTILGIPFNSTNTSQITICYKGQCPSGYYKSSVLDPLIKLEAHCSPCDPLCSNCTGPDTDRKMCITCLGYWHKNICVNKCPPIVKNMTSLLKKGSNCPKCHPQCKSTCEFSNDETSCTSCMNKKLYLDKELNKFKCLERCPPAKNYTQLYGEDAVCVTLEETMSYRQRKILFYASIGTIGFLILLFLIIGFFCKWRFHQNKIKAELKALYSNYKEPNFKNFKEDKDQRAPNMTRLQMIAISDLIFDPNSKPLGAGAFGKVFLGQWKVIGSDKKKYRLDVVIKMIHNCTKSTNDEFLEEAKIMASVSHRYCLPLIGVCLSLEKPCLISTFAKHGSLEKFLLKNADKITSFNMLQWSEQIADGMAYLNMRGIIHRDLATRNILVCEMNMVQITDFGLARLMETTKEESITVKSGRVPVRWLALETLIHSVYSSATDVWAYGVTLWEIFTYAQQPYKDIATRDIREYLQQGNRLNQPAICTLEVYMIMIKCWLEDPGLRLKFVELIKIFEKFSQHSTRYLCLPNESVPQSPIDDNMSTLQRAECIHMTDMHGNHFNVSTSHESDLIHDDGVMKKLSTTSNDQETSPLPITNQNGTTPPEWDTLLPRKMSDKKRRSGFLFSKSKKNKKKQSNTDFESKTECDSSSFTNSLLRTSEDDKSRKIASCDSVVRLLNNTSTTNSANTNQLPLNRRVATLRSNSTSNKSSSDSSNPCALSNSNPNHTSQEHIITPRINKHIHNSVSPNIIPRTFTDHNVNDPLLSQSHTSDIASLDSGNSHNFETEEPLVPPRIPSTGYYNVTPSPSSFTKLSPYIITDHPEPPLPPKSSQIILNSDNEYLEPLTNNKLS